MTRPRVAMDPSRWIIRGPCPDCGAPTVRGYWDRATGRDVIGPVTTCIGCRAEELGAALGAAGRRRNGLMSPDPAERAEAASRAVLAYVLDCLATPKLKRAYHPSEAGAIRMIPHAGSAAATAALRDAWRELVPDKASLRTLAALAPLAGSQLPEPAARPDLESAEIRRAS